IRADLPSYAIAKHKVQLTDDLDADALLGALAARYAGGRVSTEDGVKVNLDEGWAHVRTSNTEPILRVYTEAASPEAADALAERFEGELLEGS
ncbi:MAG: phosphoglucosamine mutase, partial [Bacteroidota bacterium]